MSNIKIAIHLYETTRLPRIPRLRRSSRHAEIESTYLKVYLAEEHILHRSQEIASIYEIYKYLKYRSEIINTIENMCEIFTPDNCRTILDIYLIGELSAPAESLNSRNIMLYLLDKKDKVSEKDEIYQEYCTELIDENKYAILSRI